MISVLARISLGDRFGECLACCTSDCVLPLELAEGSEVFLLTTIGCCSCLDLCEDGICND